MSATEDVVELSIRYSDCQRERDDLREKAADAKAIAVDAVAEIAQLKIEVMAARLRAFLAEGEVERVQKDVGLALELAEEGWGYASEYFQEKWEFRERVEEIRKRTTSARRDE